MNVVRECGRMHEQLVRWKSIIREDGRANWCSEGGWRGCKAVAVQKTKEQCMNARKEVLLLSNFFFRC